MINNSTTNTSQESQSSAALNTKTLITNDVIFSIAVTLNLLTTILIVRRRKSMKSVDHVILSLTVTCLAYITIVEVSRFTCVQNSDRVVVSMTNINNLLLILTHILQCLHLLLLAVQRLIAVRYPLRARHLLGIPNTKRTLAIMWSVAFVATVALVCLYVYMDPADTKSLIKVMIMVSLMFIIMTSILLLAMYTCTTVSMYLHRRTITRTHVSIRSNSRHNNNKQLRLVAICFGMTLSFIVSFTVPACLSVSRLLKYLQNTGIFEWHFTAGLSIVVGLDFILQPFFYHLSLLWSKRRKNKQCCRCFGPTGFRTTMRRRVINRGLVTPAVAVTEAKSNKT